LMEDPLNNLDEIARKIGNKNDLVLVSDQPPIYKLQIQR
jgi:hypothetical protein